MINNFYNSFDFERLTQSKRESDYRTPFQIDRDRIIHSSEFRRLQGKTQVFLPGESDFYRTRLTHSIEVAQIGRSICSYLLKCENSVLSDDYFIDPDLVEAACLAHDLGHPPFGHAGERTINSLMMKYGGFEGNAQTLRLLTEVFYRRSGTRKGMNPVRALVDAVLKYKAIFSQFEKPLNHFLYDSQKEILNFVFGGKDIQKELSDPEALNKFKTIECQIMDWADDTAYAINDIVDSISIGFINIAKIVKWQEENSQNISAKQNEYLNQIIEWIKAGNYKAQFGSQIGEFIQSCSLKERKTFMDDLTNRYKYKLVIDNRVLEKAQFYKRISVELVFQSSHLHQIENKGHEMLKRIFKLFVNNYVKDVKSAKLLPDFSDKIIRKEHDKLTRARLVCDYMSGMTDAFAMRTYKRLFDPDFSSLADIAE
ncbi:MAG: dNTP triphosphohydrolase [Melioribacteraceae bacterium]|nr:dNTP triphosphohydrolase [Melioribacteraceae bacterium]MDD3559501.1 dNTP triphosphohydrolase [Melioribacteraceae bacterium]